MPSNTETARDKVFAGILRADDRAENGEFTADDVLQYAHGSPSEGTVYNTLNALWYLGVINRDDRGNKTFWEVADDPRISAEERAID
jgi:Fe2+ or Zn2+ uptake regulation protein